VIEALCRAAQTPPLTQRTHWCSPVAPAASCRSSCAKGLLGAAIRGGWEKVLRMGNVPTALKSIAAGKLASSRYHHSSTPGSWPDLPVGPDRRVDACIGPTARPLRIAVADSPIEAASPDPQQPSVSMDSCLVSSFCADCESELGDGGCCGFLVRPRCSMCLRMYSCSSATDGQRGFGRSFERSVPVHPSPLA
jgi:hypothetical protein